MGLLPPPGRRRGRPGLWARVTSPCLSLPGISNAEARQPGKAPNFSVNWTVGDSAIEVINATTGKDELGRASRLCKHALYCRWMRVHGKVLRCPRGSAVCLHPCAPSEPRHVLHVLQTSLLDPSFLLTFQLKGWCRLV